MDKQLTLKIPREAAGVGEVETRLLDLEELRIDTDAETIQPIIRIAIKFNALSVPMWGFREKIADTAFDSTIENESREVMGFWNHNTDFPLGRRSEKTLEISKTKTLFKAAIAPNMDTSWGSSSVASINRGDVIGSSFGFLILPDGDRWELDADDNLIRTLVNVDLREVSPTASPAYPQSSAKVRSVEEIRHALKIAEARECLAVTSSAVTELLKEDEEQRALIALQIADRQRRDRLHREVVRQNT